MACKYVFNYGDTTRVFDNEQQVLNFIYENSIDIDDIIEHNGVGQYGVSEGNFANMTPSVVEFLSRPKFSKETSAWDTSNAMKSKLKETFVKSETGGGISFNEEKHEYRRHGRSYTSVTTLITEARKDDDSRYIPEFQEESYRKNAVNQLKSEGYDEATANSIVKENIADWENRTVIGTVLHKIHENFIKKWSAREGYNVDAMLNDYISELEATGETVSDESKAKIKDFLEDYQASLKSFYNDLKDKHGAHSNFLTEFRIFNDEAQVAGTIDLLVIAEDGSLHIYDYKVSTKSVNDWHSAKINTNDYQQAVYSQMLKAAGFTVSSLNIVPIKVDERDASGKIITRAYVDDNAIKDLTIVSGLTPGSEKMMNAAKMLNITNVVQLKEDLNDNLIIKESMQTLFNYEVRMRGTQADFDKLKAKMFEMYDKDMAAAKDDEERKKVKYKFWDSVKGRFVVSSDKIMATHNLKEYLENRSAQFENLPRRFKTFYQEAYKQYIKTGELDIDELNKAWAADRSRNDAGALGNMVGRYIRNNDWEFLESPEAEDLGIVMFRNKKTSEVEIINITNNDLNINQNAKEFKHKNILGMHFKNHEVRGLTDYPANNDMFESLKVAMFLTNNADKFKGMKFSMMRNVQIDSFHHIKNVSPHALENVMALWSKVEAKIPVPELSPSSNKVQYMDKIEALLGYITTFKDFKEAKYSNVKKNMDIEQTMRDINKSTNEKIAVLNNLIKSLRYMSGGKDFYEHDARINEFMNLAYEAMIQLGGVKVDFYDDIANLGGIITENATFGDPEKFRNKFFANTVRLIDSVTHNVTNDFKAFKDKTLDSHYKFYEGNGISTARTKIIGSNLEQFNSLYEFKDGKFTGQFKSLGDPTLTPSQEKYLRQMLNVINLIRLREAGVYDGEISPDIDYRKVAEEVDADKHFPDFASRQYNVPLMKRSVTSALKGKGYIAGMRDYWQNMLDKGEWFSNENINRNKQQEEVRNFMLDSDNSDFREKLFNGEADTEFETDLEMIVDTLFFNHAKTERFNTVMPVINATKYWLAAAGYNYIHINDDAVQENILTTLDNYTKVNVFKESLVEKGGEGTAKAISVLSDTTSMMILGISPISGVTETFTGLWANMTHTAAFSSDPRHPGFTTMAKAYSWVMADVVEGKMDATQFNFLEQLNVVYRMSGMDVNQIKQRLKSDGSGLIGNFKSGIMYKMMSAPDYLHRMSMLTAYMMHAGILKLDGVKPAADSPLTFINGKIVYRPELDPRFSLYLNNKNEQNPSKEWKEQRALYLKMLEDSTNDGISDGKTLKMPYTHNEVRRVRGIANDVFGNYDDINKMMVTHTALGRMWGMFKTWTRAKANRLYLEGRSDETRGYYEPVYDDNGEIVTYEWTGTWTEGAIQSILALMANGWDLKNPVKAWDKLLPEQKNNIKWLLSDLMAWLILSMLLSMLDMDELKKDAPIGYMGVKGINNSVRDLNIFSSITAMTGGDRSPLPALGFIQGVIDDSSKVILGDMGFEKFITNNVRLADAFNTLINTGS